MQEVTDTAAWQGHPDLSQELWAKVFSYLTPVFQASCEASLPEFLRELYIYRQLPAVCKRFNIAFLLHPELHTTLLLSQWLEGNDLPAIFNWIYKYAGATQTLAASCGSPFLESALSALSTARAPARPRRLSTVHISNMPETATHLLAQFTSIVNCTLDLRHTTDLLSLQPFQALCQLETLELQNGSVMQLDAALHLTSLSLQRCKAACADDWACVSSLQRLSLYKSSLVRIHCRGLSACSSLVSLTCQDACILASNTIDITEDLRCTESELLTVPDSVSALTGLTHLQLQYASLLADGPEMQLHWLCELPALRRLDLMLNVADVTFPASMTMLQRLSDLRISCTGHVLFSFDWCGMPAVQALHIEVSQFTFDYDLTNLVYLDGLAHVDIIVHGRCAAKTTRQIAMLARSLAFDRPEVSFSLI